MKKIALLSLVLVLLAVSAIPVLAAKPGNGHGNGASAGQGNSGENHGQQNKQNQESKGNKGLGRNGNQGNNRMRTPFYLQGTITGVFSDTITVDVMHSNATVKKFFNNTFTDTMTTTLTVNVTGTTKFFKITQGGDNEDETTGDRLPIPFSDLAIGQHVAIHGNFVNGVFTATLITVYDKTTVGEPAPEPPEATEPPESP